jgi:hypothetical protein
MDADTFDYSPFDEDNKLGVVGILMILSAIAAVIIGVTLAVHGMHDLNQNPVPIHTFTHVSTLE